MKILATILTSLVCMQAIASPHESGWFCYAPYGQSLLSDMHPDCVRWDVAAHSNHSSYDWADTGNKVRTTAVGNFGLNLPIWSGNMGGGRFGISVTMAASANLWLDILEKVTAPVINTDYRIGLPTVTFIHRLDKGFVSNYSIALSPFKHESTHIGDELTLEHMDRGYVLRRVNVSNNYTQLVATLNEPENRTVQCHTFRAGLLLLFSAEAGWYTVYPTDGDPSLLMKKRSPWEAYVQYQYQSPSARCGIQGVASIEVRNRALYGYTYDGNGHQEESRVFTYNAFIGARYNAARYQGIFSHVAFGIRAYHGNCPYGQFRNLPGYSQIGLSLIFE